VAATGRLRRAIRGAAAGHAIPIIPPGFAANDEPIYLVKRFDRTPTGRVHVEDFAQVSDVLPQEKYGQQGTTYDSTGRAITALLGPPGLEAYVKRLVAAVVVGNIDAHLKNWALIYPDGRTPALAPVYDFHSLTVFSRFRYQPLALALAGEQMPSAITVDHFRRLAETCETSPDLAAVWVAQATDALRTAWSKGVAAEASDRLPALAQHYERRLAELPIASG
jgi:serine/threonine-protein kinase HipA